jgi:hypothetical protein
MSKIRTAFLVLGCCTLASWVVSSAGKGAETKKIRKGHFTVGARTTYVTGPRDKDGYIDYAAALNKRLRKGVTPANNANVLLWKAFGPHPEGATMPLQFFKWMGIKPPPERGKYYRDLYRYSKAQLPVGPPKALELFFDQLDRASRGPWTENQYPFIAGWLKANSKPLALVVRAAKRSHYYSPLVSKASSGLRGALLPAVQKSRELAAALTARAMLRLGRKAYADAWQDLLACHRLGRLIARGGSFIEVLVGVVIDYLAGKADLAFLDQARLKPKQFEQCLRDLQKLSPLPRIADKVDLCERFMVLDEVMMIDRYGVQRVAMPGVADEALDRIDWDPALRTINRWFDRVAAALRDKDRASQERKLDRIDRDLKMLQKKVANSRILGGNLPGGKPPAQVRGQAVGELLVYQMLPAVRKVHQAAQRARQIEDNLQVAFALAWYRGVKGRYPQQLAALAPRYLKRVPRDRFSGKALIYRAGKDGYLLYSVGVNGKDEGGRGYEDTPPGDDLVVRMPAR